MAREGNGGVAAAARSLAPPPHPLTWCVGQGACLCAGARAAKHRVCLVPTALRADAWEAARSERGREPVQAGVDVRAGAVQGGKAMRGVGGVKRTFIRPAYNLAKKVMPKISPTEEAALSSGTISWYVHFLKSLHYSDFKQHSWAKSVENFR
jgi:hypothetical protein